MSSVEPVVSRDPTHAVLREAPTYLDPIFAPKSVAVIGATEAHNSVGRTLLRNLIGTPFGGAVYPVNPKRSHVLGIKAYPNILAVPDKVDLAVVVTPAPTVPGVIKECVDAGVRGAIIISAGFREVATSGALLEQEILEHARRGKMRIIGPNCLGVMNPLTGLNATFAGSMARPGNVGFISQSGALCTSILDWSFREMVGFSAFISVGAMLDVGWGDLIDYLGDDPRTESILIYMESIGDARSFLSAAREVALNKPIIVIKAGRTEAAAQAAASHTGALTGSDEVLEAAFRRVGVLRVNNIADLFDMAEVLAKQPRPRGPKLTILTNAGGPGVLATDALIGGGGKLATLSPETVTALNEFLPPHWSHQNPIDILGDAGPERYTKALEVIAKDPESDGILVMLTPQAMTDPTQTAEQVKQFAHIEGKPILANWMGGAEVEAGDRILNRANLPTFEYPDMAARAFNYMWRYTYNLQGLYETPAIDTSDDERAPGRAKAAELIRSVQQSGRTLLTEAESKQLLAAYGIPTVQTAIATSRDQAVAHAEKMGFPVALKLHSETITHKSDVGGVRLNLSDATSVETAYDAIEAALAERGQSSGFQGVTVQPMIRQDGFEIILGSAVDAQFGPVLLFGAGGQLVEIFKDRALALPPLNATLARRLMEQTSIYRAFKGVRGREPVDVPALEQLLARFSELVVEQPWIKECDINPLLVSGSKLTALDARVVLHDSSIPEASLPRPAIRPYPTQYVTPWTLPNGTRVTIRPIRPEDEPLMAKFHETLSEQSVRLRYFHLMKLSRRVAHARLLRVCFNDYDRELALVVERKDPATSERQILGIGRLSRRHFSNEAEFALLISDQWQRQGLGSQLLKRLIEIGRAENLHVIRGEILQDNIAMQAVCKSLGFRLTRTADGTVIRGQLDLPEG